MQAQLRRQAKEEREATNQRHVRQVGELEARLKEMQETEAQLQEEMELCQSQYQEQLHETQVLPDMVITASDASTPWAQQSSAFSARGPWQAMLAFANISTQPCQLMKTERVTVKMLVFEALQLDKLQ